jgi:hypothetical protein
MDIKKTFTLRGGEGRGKVLYGLDEILGLFFSWGLGEDNNNMIEALSF